MREHITGRARRLLPAALNRRTALGLAAALAFVAVFYYPVGMALTHVIDDDTAFEAGVEDAVEGGSRAVAIATALIDREVTQHRWVANDPWFLAPAALDNMPNYQQGIIGALARFAFELTDQIGRTRGSSHTDPNLQEASGQLQYAGNIWLFDFSTSLAPTTPSESRYEKARRSLLTYNRRVAEGAANFERRADNLLATLDRFALDLGASSAVLDQHLALHSGGLLDFRADDIFYGVKGQTYAYYLLLRELGLDYANVIAERELAKAWAQMLASMRHAAELSPWVVVNGAPDAAILPSHLAAQGFYLLRARTNLKEITNILLK
jgi:hypothetical protein